MDKIYITYILIMEEIIESIIEPLIQPIIKDVKEPYHDNNWDLVISEILVIHYYN
jgi:hypothetical protein